MVEEELRALRNSMAAIGAETTEVLNALLRIEQLFAGSVNQHYASPHLQQQHQQQHRQYHTAALQQPAMQQQPQHRHTPYGGPNPTHVQQHQHFTTHLQSQPYLDTTPLAATMPIYDQSQMSTSSASSSPLPGHHGSGWQSQQPTPTTRTNLMTATASSPSSPHTNSAFTAHSSSAAISRKRRHIASPPTQQQTNLPSSSSHNHFFPVEQIALVDTKKSDDIVAQHAEKRPRLMDSASTGFLSNTTAQSTYVSHAQSNADPIASSCAIAPSQQMANNAMPSSTNNRSVINLLTPPSSTSSFDFFLSHLIDLEL